jgi:RNA polymerase sigma factor (sigma-70 family)
VLSATEVEHLVEQALAGENESFSALARAHYRAAYCSALSIVRVSADAEDVVQDAMVSAFTELESCREPAKFSGWLLSIVRRAALMSLRKRGRARKVQDAAAPTDEAAPTHAPDVFLRERLLAAAGALSDRQAEVLFLHDLEGWTHPELADALGISEVNARQILFEARKKMRARLGTTQSLEVSHDGT